MPSVSEKQRRFFGAELGRKKKGKKTKTGMSMKQLTDFARKPARKMRAGRDFPSGMQHILD